MTGTRKPRLKRKAAPQKVQRKRARRDQALLGLTGKEGVERELDQSTKAHLDQRASKLEDDRTELTHQFIKKSNKAYYNALAQVLFEVEAFDRLSPPERAYFLNRLAINRFRKGTTIEHILLDHMVQYPAKPGTRVESRNLLSRDALALQEVRARGITAAVFASMAGEGVVGLDRLARAHARRRAALKGGGVGETLVPDDIRKEPKRLKLAVRVPIEIKTSNAEEQHVFVAVIFSGGGVDAPKAQLIGVERIKGIDELSVDDGRQLLDQILDLYSRPH